MVTVGFHLSYLLCPYNIKVSNAMTLEHLSVLTEEAIEGLAIKPAGIYIDATFGRGGHSMAILDRLGSTGRLMAIDKDPEAIKVGRNAPFAQDTRFSIEKASFATLKALVEEYDWMGRVDGVLMDLGVSSPQIDDPERGFSFMKEGPLDMRMDPQSGISAADWLNQADEVDIANVIYQYGEERYSRRIAKAIVAQRAEEPFTTTSQLAEVVDRASPSREKKKHPATRTFQAIRIFINDELKDLQVCLQECMDVLKVGGRLCAISFHSLEDRIVKQFIQKQERGIDVPPEIPVQEHAMGRRLRKINGLIRPSEQEMSGNIRARSARLRIAEKLA